MTSPVVLLDGIGKRFGGRGALSGVSLSVGRGELLVLLGTNGAGKTTLLRILLGMLRPDEGRALVSGGAICDETRRRVGYITEIGGLEPEARVTDSVEHLLRLRGLDAAGARRETASSLERFGLTGDARRKIGTLSKGTQQRVKLASALAGDPLLVVADEPFTGLDPLAARAAADELRRYAAGGGAVIVSTHELRWAEALGTQLALLHRGRVLLSGTMDELRRRHAVVVRAQVDYRGCELVAHHRQGQRGTSVTLREGATASQLLAWMVERGVEVESFEAAPSLEDIFAAAVLEAERGESGPRPEGA